MRLIKKQNRWVFLSCGSHNLRWKFFFRSNHTNRGGEREKNDFLVFLFIIWSAYGLRRKYLTKKKWMTGALNSCIAIKSEPWNFSSRDAVIVAQFFYRFSTTTCLKFLLTLPNENPMKCIHIFMLIEYIRLHYYKGSQLLEGESLRNEYFIALFSMHVKLRTFINLQRKCIIWFSFVRYVLSSRNISDHLKKMLRTG